MTLDPKAWEGHASGPWRARKFDDEWEVVKDDPHEPKNPWFVCGVCEACDDGDTRATAALIAAAPALASRVEELEAENAKLREALEPFARFTDRDHESGEKRGEGVLYERTSDGRYCLPDSHGYEVLWVGEDEHGSDGATVEFTAGQFRRARAALDPSR